MLPLTTLAGIEPGQLAMLIPIVAIVGGFTVAIVGAVTSAMRDTSERKQIEESRREIAAYVAEGSMTPEDASRLLESVPAKVRKKGCCSRT